MRKYELKVNDQTYKIEVKAFSEDEAKLVVNGKPITVQVSGIEQETIKPKRAPTPITTSGSNPAPAPARAAAPPLSRGANSIVAPIPGKVLDLLVKVGDSVSVGQATMKMEAMKMENVINASVAGTITEILVNEGDAVSQGQELIRLG